MHAELRLGQGIHCGRKRVERLMRTTALQGVRRRRMRGCTRRDLAAIPNDDLVQRRFSVAEPNRLWCADVTQHRTGEGWLYERRGAGYPALRLERWGLGNDTLVGFGLM